MHYGDQEQINNNLLKIVIYFHTTDTSKLEIEVCSIQECKYFPIRLLQKILTAPEILNLTLDTEEWYLITIRSNDGWLDFSVIGVENVSQDEENKFLKLH